MKAAEPAVTGSRCRFSPAEKDVVVVVGGGSHHHVGAVALAVPRPSLADPSQISASASVLCVVGHKEDELARKIALRMASSLNRLVTVIAGIHIDTAAAQDIDALVGNCEILIERVVARLGKTLSLKPPLL